MFINIDFKLPEKENTEKISNQEITWNWIQYACMQKYPSTRDQSGQMTGGMGRTTLRIWGRIQRKFDEAIEKNLDSIESEEAEKDLLKKLFGGEDIKFPVGSAKIVSMIQDEVDKLTSKTEVKEGG